MTWRRSRTAHAVAAQQDCAWRGGAAGLRRGAAASLPTTTWQVLGVQGVSKKDFYLFLRFGILIQDKSFKDFCWVLKNGFISAIPRSDSWEFFSGKD